MFISDKIEVIETAKGRSVFTKSFIAKDEIIFEFEKRFIDRPIKTSLQIDYGVHQVSTDPDAIENCLNHSCEPNGHIKFEDLTFRALIGIKKGEELTFNYLTTEWDFANKFDCQCGSKKCFHKLWGFKYLTLKQKKSLKPWLSPFLKKKLAEEEMQVVK